MVREDRLEPSHPAEAFARLAVRNRVEPRPKSTSNPLEYLGGIAKRNAADEMYHVVRHRVSFQPRAPCGYGSLMPAL
jgi:hypothetical protein